ncbi:MAG TPA: formate/nitrite transporter family protein [Terriglobales bacterium]|nr:formate/nitrite transporter family protein [Terriglobales bacterium]
MAETVTTRRTAHEIFEKVIENASDELRRSSRALAFSGVAGGMGMGLTGLSVAVAQSVLGAGPWQEFAALLFYPLGFIAVIIGRAQLFTENTLFPVALILSERKHVLNTLRLWSVVFVANIGGAMLFAFVTMKTGALPYEVGIRLAALGMRSVAGTSSHVFWSGVIGGWIIALMAWTVTASHWTVGQIAVTWMLTAVVGLGRFAHCIATSGEILSAVFTGQVAMTAYGYWLLFATIGNIAGGVTFVTLLNFGQVTLEE